MCSSEHLQTSCRACAKRCPDVCRWEQFNSVQNLGHGNRVTDKSSSVAWCRYHRRHNGLGTRTHHKFGNDVCVEHDHQRVLQTLTPYFRSSSQSGSFMGWRGMAPIRPRRREQIAPDRLCQICASLGLLGSFPQRALQDLACLVLHGSAMDGRTHFELALGRFLEVSDSNACHAINDIIAIIDCKQSRCPIWTSSSPELRIVIAYFFSHAQNGREQRCTLEITISPILASFASHSFQSR